MQVKRDRWLWFRKHEEYLDPWREFKAQDHKYIVVENEMYNPPHAIPEKKLNIMDLNWSDL